MWFVGIQDLQKRWLSIMKVTHVNTVATTIGCLVHLWICYFFVIEKEWGIEGLGWACYTSALITTCIMLVHTFLVPQIQDAVFIQSDITGRDAMVHIATGLKVTIIMVAFVVALEVRLYFAGYLGDAEIAATAALINFTNIILNIGSAV
jgi:Na+-driven multidrug efflux pump